MHWLQAVFSISKWMFLLWLISCICSPLTANTNICCRQVPSHKVVYVIYKSFRKGYICLHFFQISFTLKKLEFIFITNHRKNLNELLNNTLIAKFHVYSQLNNTKRYPFGEKRGKNNWTLPVFIKFSINKIIMCHFLTNWLQIFVFFYLTIRPHLQRGLVYGKSVLV